MPADRARGRDDLRPDDIAKVALAETAGQEYIGDRDLAEWRTHLGRVAARLALQVGRWMSPYRLLAVSLLVGMLAVAALSVAAAEVYEEVVEGDGVAQLDQPVLDAAVSVRTDAGDAAVGAFTGLGGTVGMGLLATTTAVVLALSWRQWAPMVLIAAAAAGSVTVTVVAKAVVGRLRPPRELAVAPYEQSFSFPSGHALNSVVIAGVVAYLLVRRQTHPGARWLTVALLALFALAMGLSRVYLGHHWLSDVLVAWLLGLAWLTVVVTAHRLFLTVRRLSTSAPVGGSGPQR